MTDKMNFQDGVKMIINEHETVEEVEGIMKPIKDLIDMLEPELMSQNHYPNCQTPQFLKQTGYLLEYEEVIKLCEQRINEILELNK